MTNDTDIIALRKSESVDDPLTEIGRDGARRMLAAALRAEADAFVAQHAPEVLPDGCQRVVRHGYGPERSIQTGIGALDLRLTKVRDRTAGPADDKVWFSSAILPKWARRSAQRSRLPILLQRPGSPNPDRARAHSLQYYQGAERTTVPPTGQGKHENNGLEVDRVIMNLPGSAGARCNTWRHKAKQEFCLLWRTTMATFFYGLACVFNQAGNSANFSQNDTQVPLTGTVEDDGADTTFSVNEAVTDPGFETLFPDYLGPPADPEPTVVGSFDTGSDVWLVVLVPNSSPNASGQSGNDNLVFYGPSGADKSLLPGPRTNITIENDIDQNDVPECFAAGTLIQTPSGEQKVEDLAIGDLIMTAENKPVAVKWIGRQTIVYGFMGGGLAPVRIMAGALCDERPHTDLLVTADHGIIVDGLVITASSLINGVTIVLEPLVNLPPRMTYYHIELEGHDAIYANGAIAETYVDYRTRQGFDNYREYVGLYGGQQTIREMELPRISTARLVPQTLRTRLAIMAD